MPVTASGDSNPVLVIYGVKGDAQRYRCSHLEQQLGLYGIPSCVREFDEVSLSEADGYGVLILHRVPLDRYSIGLIGRVRARGGVILFDADDLVFDSSVLDRIHALSGEDRIGMALYKNEVQRCRRTMELADAVLVSTGFLARRVAALGKLARIHRNGFSLQMLALSEQARAQRPLSGDGVIIGYASGTPTHDRDFEEAKAALQHIVRKYPQSELWLVGRLDAGSDWDGLHGRIKRIPSVPWQRLPGLLARLDVNIAPLEVGNPYCQAKSEVKYIEAGLVRVPTVASKTDAFEFAIRPGENGFLATTHQDWVDSLERLVEDPALRREMGERAHADVLQRYHPIVRGRELIATLNEIGRHVNGHPFWPDDPRPLVRRGELEQAPAWGGLEPQPTTERRRPLVQRALYALRYRGVRILLMQSWVYLRRHLAQIHPFGSAR